MGTYRFGVEAPIKSESKQRRHMSRRPSNHAVACVVDPLVFLSLFTVYRCRFTNRGLV